MLSERKPKWSRQGGQKVLGGLAFPGDAPTTYWDFAYFSFVIGMTAQTSDTGVTSLRMRRLVLVHGLLAFGFNTAVVALTINVQAGLILASRAGLTAAQSASR